jgi:2-polyprenyl-3-methyl-5-hydroxy-6-metoxy-1,4-benzoquinol methylase
VKHTAYKEAVLELASMLEKANVPYSFTKEAALFIQGVPIIPQRIHLLIQWDLLDSVHELFNIYGASPIEKEPGNARFELYFEGFLTEIACFFNTTIKTDPYRITVKMDGQELFSRSLYSELYFTEGSPFKEAILAHLLKEQQVLTGQNEQAWNQNNYTALINRYGEPEQVAEKIRQNPQWRLHPFYKYMKDLQGKKVMHLLGSNGVKATSLSLLGAEVTVVDFSKENASFAHKVAEAAGVSFNYIVSDVLSLEMEKLHGKFDYVLMELGVLHYFIALQPLMDLVNQLLTPGGKFVLHEFHPISTKLITSTGKKHKVTGNYFDPTLHYSTVAFSKHMPEGAQEALSQTVQRKWTLGELVTTVAGAGLFVEVLEEEPNHKIHDIGLPKTFTLVARKQG